jgi:uncharacterized membrane protein
MVESTGTPPIRARPPVHGIDFGRIEEAVRAAERRTRGEIRVALSRFYFWGDVTRAAERAFAHLRMDRTRERNGVLIFVAPWRRRFAIIGDSGIHARVTPGFWDQLVGPLAEAFRAGDPNGGLVRAIDAVAEQLAACFPPEPADASSDDSRGDASNDGGGLHRVNQLPDSVAFDPGRRRD